MLNQYIRRISTSLHKTKMIHNSNIKIPNNSIIQPIYKTSSYYFKSCNEGKNMFENVNNSNNFVYNRMNHPNVQNLEEKISILDCADDSIVFSSGMLSITTTLLSFLKPNDHMLYTSSMYSATNNFCKEWLKTFNIESTPINNLDNITNEIKNNTKIIFIETPSNPLLKLTSINSISNIAKKKKRKYFSYS